MSALPASPVTLFHPELKAKDPLVNKAGLGRGEKLKGSRIYSGVGLLKTGSYKNETLGNGIYFNFFDLCGGR